MADSDNTTTLPPVTRRELIAGTAIAVAGWKRNAFNRNDLEIGPSTDPAVAVWCQWQDAHNFAEQLCRRQQRLEQKLIEMVGFPGASTRMCNGETVTLHSFEPFHDVPNPGPENAEAFAQAEAKLTTHHVRWNAADEEIGYSATLSAEREAGERAQDLLKVLSETPAASLVGVLAKLDAALREGQASDDSGDLPWPLIRSAFEDIGRISRKTE
jgi:hypothetical protein